MSTQHAQVPTLAVILAATTMAFLPVASSADDSARINRLETEIQQLRTQIDVALRRIQQLEEEIERKNGEALVGATPPKLPDQAPTPAPLKAGNFPWHSPEPWTRIRPGMTQAEVVAILGEPTQVESMESYKTLFYRGSVAGTGSPNGLVNLRDDKVVAVKKPAF